MGTDRPRRDPARRALLSATDEPDAAPDPEPAHAFFGRRRGKRLRAAQEERLSGALPRLRLQTGPAGLDPAAAFDHQPRRITLEIGFGSGEHLAREAAAYPDDGFIGCEPFVNGMAKLLGLVAEQGLVNVRLWDGDAAELIERLPEASIDILYLLYPDPWPKRRQRKRRFVSDDRLGSIARLLRSGGEFRFATDIDDYAGWTLARTLSNPLLRWSAAGPEDWRQPWPNWSSTRYEAKALEQGRRPTYLSFRRV